MATMFSRRRGCNARMRLPGARRVDRVVGMWLFWYLDDDDDSGTTTTAATDGKRQRSMVANDDGDEPPNIHHTRKPALDAAALLISPRIEAFGFMDDDAGDAKGRGRRWNRAIVGDWNRAADRLRGFVNWYVS